jgi:hypothetical protein
MPGKTKGIKGIVETSPEILRSMIVVDGKRALWPERRTIFWITKIKERREFGEIGPRVSEFMTHTGLPKLYSFCYGYGDISCSTSLKKSSMTKKEPVKAVEYHQTYFWKTDV